MSYRYQEVKRYKRGAKWPNGDIRMCTRCGALDDGHRTQATVTALMKYGKTKFKMPVAYCDDHTPDQLVKV